MRTLYSLWDNCTVESVTHWYLFMQRERQRGAWTGPLSWSDTDFSLEREDLGMSLLLCPGKMFRQGN
jgi:hypothetical protein